MAHRSTSRARNPARLARGLFVLALAAQGVATVIVGRFPNTDEVFYKAAGREWAQSGRFAAPELEGFTASGPPIEQVYFPYPPLYPQLFGVWVKLAGFGWRACVAYDAAVHLALVLATLFVAGRLLPGAAPAWRLGLAALVLPLGTSGRPDELAMTLGLVGLGLLLGEHTGVRTSATAGVCAGLSTGTAPGAGVMLAAQAALLLASESRPARRRLLLLAAWGASAALSLGGVVARVLAWMPNAWEQMLGQPAVRDRAAAHVLSLQLDAWRPGAALLVFTLGLACVGLSEAALAPRHVASWARLWLVPLAAVAAVFVVLPGKHTYLWMWGPWLLAVAGRTLWLAWQQGHRRRAGLVGLVMAACVAVASAPALHRGLVLLGLPADQTLEAGAARLRALVPRGARVLADDELWWITAGEYDVVDAAWSRPADLGNIEWVVLSGNGTGVPGRPRALPPHFAPYVAAHFEPVDDGLNPRPVRLAGLTLSRSGYGFGALVLRRRAVTPARP